jgi:hypothetical protein
MRVSCGPDTQDTQTCSNSKEGRPVAKPNYSFEKRQRELAKKKKKEEKLKEKAERKSGAPATGDGPAEDGTDTQAGAAPAAEGAGSVGP